MALARKCDRCGKLYEHYPRKDEDIWNGIVLVRLASTGEMIRRGNVMDLCTYCMNDLQTFLKNRMRM